jgi:hypothetical protein
MDGEIEAGELCMSCQTFGAATCAILFACTPCMQACACVCVYSAACDPLGLRPGITRAYDPLEDIPPVDIEMSEPV